MKTLFYQIVIAIVLTGFFSCNDVLDIEDLGSYSPDNVWNDEKLSTAYLSNLYANSLGGWPVNMGSFADETSGILGSEAIQPNKGSFKIWPYEAIYKINLMLEGLEDGTLSEELKTRLKSEALFLRAYNYFQSLMVHGGIPYITYVQQQGVDDLNVKRNSTAECFDFIIKDLDYAIANLPEINRNDAYGRIDASAALAFKAKVLLYKASPQFNPVSLYNNAYVNEAYEANKLAYETLSNRGYKLLDDYTDVFETKGHMEAVLAVIFNNPNKLDGRGEQVCRPLSESKDDTGGDQPIWSLIEAYPMKDGKKIGESTKYPYDLQTYWKDRDPRFEASQVWNGSVFELSGKVGRRQYTVFQIASIDDAFCMESAGYNRTGFYPRKGIMESNPQAEVKNNDYDWLEMRFAEVMFNYAEIACAKNITDIGYDILKQIRKRAGIEPGEDNMYGLKSNMNPTDMRNALLDEKRIEFTFEGQRFWDLRRNRMFSVIHGIRKYGLEGTYKGEITPEVQQRANRYELMPEDFTYHVQETYSGGEKVMSLPDTYYFFPIMQSSIEQNENLEQNKDWGGTFNPALE